MSRTKIGGGMVQQVGSFPAGPLKLQHNTKPDPTLERVSMVTPVVYITRPLHGTLRTRHSYSGTIAPWSRRGLSLAHIKDAITLANITVLRSVERTTYSRSGLIGSGSGLGLL